jgi:hypothetical protein
MWVLIWVIVSAGGGVAAGSNDFPSKEACKQASEEFAFQTLEAAALAKTKAPGISSNCIQKATGKP